MDLIGIHGTKQKYIHDTLEKGLVRKSSAWFIYSALQTKDELRRSIFLTLYFSISLSTLRKVSDHQKWCWYEWYKMHPEETPALLLFNWNRSQEDEIRYYNCQFSEYQGLSLPYTKVEMSQKIPPVSISRKVEVPVFLEICKHFDLTGGRTHSKKYTRFFHKYPINAEMTDLNIPNQVEYLAGDLCSFLEPHYTNAVLDSIGSEQNV